MIVLGLTGGIAMGKSTIGAMMDGLGVPVHESDDAVHALLKRDSPARPALAAAFPYYEYPELYQKKTYDFDRKALGKLVFHDDEQRALLESILHPLVRAEQQDFIREHKRKGYDMVCLDIPLLFETGAESRVDHTIVVSAPAFLQKQRVMERPNMNEEKFAHIVSRQMSDAEKCHRADYVIKTGIGRAHSMKELKAVLDDIKVKSGLVVAEPDLDDDLVETY